MATVFLFKLDNFKNEFLANFQQKIESRDSDEIKV